LSFNLQSVPESGIKSINGVTAPSGNINIVSTDLSVTVTPNILTKEIDLIIGASTSSGVTFTATCDSTVFVGAAVVSDGTKLINGLADGSTSILVLGIVESKPNSTTAVVRFTGLSSSVFISLDYTKQYFLSDSLPGVVTPIPVTTVGNYLIKVGVPFNSTQLIINTTVIARRS
jgi:hypothetical protein